MTTDNLVFTLLVTFVMGLKAIDSTPAHPPPLVSVLHRLRTLDSPDSLQKSIIKITEANYPFNFTSNIG